MKNITPFICFSLALAGCTSARIAGPSLQQALADYRSVEAGMTEEEVVALLGAPDRTDKDGTLHWWVDRPPTDTIDHYAELDVHFDADARVVGTQVRSGTDHYAAVGGGPARMDEPRESTSLFRP